ncbi:hypothetical protein CPB83DRAFT_850946 [Crepidotus variabilis]|uniref:Uncharacterized protein n=1 Tax=Crepidotus variabilis TaxID=179855 RepID=A0A9P6EJW5_9AGAR|nr:hypothetical protein CPB83DRAFT_850946 [Crepidotus variabilis]
MFSFRSLFRSNKSKYAATRFPPNWPSYLHNKCNDATCCFPNPPQAIAGMYTCQGSLLNGRHCNGTYEVSSSMARSTLKSHLVPTAPRTSPNAPAPARPPRPEVRATQQKNLPPIPGLGQRHIQARRAAQPMHHVAAPKPQPVANTHYPCYPGPVQGFYAPAAPSYRYDNARPRRHAMNNH